MQSSLSIRRFVAGILCFVVLSCGTQQLSSIGLVESDPHGMVVANLEFDHGAHIVAGQWNSDGSLLAVAGSRTGILDAKYVTTRIYSYNATEKFMTELRACQVDHGDMVWAVDWSSDDNYLLVGGLRNNNIGDTYTSHRVYQYHSATESLTEVVGARGDHGLNVIAVAWAPDGAHFAIGGERNGTVSVRIYSFDGTTATEVTTARADHGIEVRALSWTSDGLRLAVGGRRTNVIAATETTHRVFAFNSGAGTLTELTGSRGDHGALVSSLAWDASDLNLAVAGARFDTVPSDTTQPSYTHRIYEFNTTTSAMPELVDSRADHGSFVWHVAWNAAGTRLAIAGEQVSGLTNRIYSFDSGAGTLAEETSGVVSRGGGRAHTVGWCPGGTDFMVGGDRDVNVNHSLELFNFNTSSHASSPIVAARESLGYMARSMAWTPNGTYLVVAGWHEPARRSLNVYKFNSTTSTLTKLSFGGEIDFGSDVSAVAWTADNQYLAVGGRRNNALGGSLASVRVFQFNSSNETFSEVTGCRFDHGAMVMDLDWSSDSAYLAIGGIRNNKIASTNTTHRVLAFNSGAGTLSEVTGCRADHGGHCFAIDWNAANTKLFVGGIRNANISATMTSHRVYTFNSGAGTLTEQTAARGDHGGIVWAGGWMAAGTHFGVGGQRNNNIASTYTTSRIYSFNGTTAAEVTTARTAMGGDEIRSFEWAHSGSRALLAGERAVHDGAGDFATHCVYNFDSGAGTMTMLGYCCEDHGSRIVTGAWNTGDCHIAVGGIRTIDAANNLTARVYSFVPAGTTLNREIASLSDHGTDVMVLDWHPGRNHLAIGGVRFDTNLSDTSAPSYTSRVYRFDHAAKTLTDLAGCRVDHGNTVYDLAWTFSGVYMAIGGAQFDSDLSDTSGPVYTSRVYEFSSTSSTLTELANCQMNHGAAVMSIGWTTTTAGTYLAVGGRRTEDSITHRIYRFDMPSQSMVELAGCAMDFGDNVSSLSWSYDGVFLAVGGKRVPLGDDYASVRIYQFDPIAETLTEVVTARIDHGQEIYDLEWAPTSYTLALKGAGYDNINIRIYTYNVEFSVFTEKYLARTYNIGYGGTIQWAPNELSLATCGYRDDKKTHQVYLYDAGAGTLTEAPWAMGDQIRTAHCARWIDTDGCVLAVAGDRAYDQANSMYVTHGVYSFAGGVPTLDELKNARSDYMS